MKDLPQFKSQPLEQVKRFAALVLTPFEADGQSRVRRLIDYPDGHYRVIFDPSYFLLGEGQSEPTKSQWNNLKKKFKRHDHRAFVFKDHGQTGCDEGDEGDCYYIDFGFFAD